MDGKIYEWIADYSKGVIVEEDFKLLKIWIEEDPEHSAIFENALRMYKNAQEVGFVDQMNPDRSWNMLEKKLKRREWKSVVRWVVAASVFLGGIVGGWLTWSNREAEEMLLSTTTTIPGNASVILYMADGKSVSLSNGEVIGLVEKDGTEIWKDSVNNMLVYQANPKLEQSVLHAVVVPVGGEFDLTLSDGTRVWLNSGTELRFPTHFTGGTREVHVSGEAFFHVQQDSLHPFIVHTEGASVRVLGTMFNLSAYPGDRMVTTLSKGKVEVADGTRKVCLQPGEQAIWTKELRYIDVRKVEASVYSSWVKGVFEFENMSLREITKQLSRWYGVTFQFEDESCAERRFTGGIKKYIPLNQSLDIIEKTTNVMFKMKERVIIVTSR